MDTRHDAIDRRTLLGAGAAAVVAMSPARGEETKAPPKATAAEGEPKQKLSELIADFVVGFDLTRAPLMRLSLLRLSGDTYRFIWSLHHLIIDGWSLPLLVKEVFALPAVG